LFYNANPNALLLATTSMDAIRMIGMPEARIILSECAIYLATSPKSNSAYLAIDKALETVRSSGGHPVPLPLRNAPTKLMKELDYGAGYQYAHDFPGHFVQQDFLPEALRRKILYEPADNAAEARVRQKLKEDWRDWYTY